MKKAVSIILAMIMTVSSIPQYAVTAEEAGKDETMVMEIGESYEVNMDEGNVLYYSFVPTENGEYVFISEGDYDAYAYLLDAQEREIAYDDDGGNGFNFRLNVNLTAGETYFLKLGSYEDGAEYYISVMRESFFLDYEENVTVIYGEEAQLVVNAVSEEGEQISYQWYQFQNDEYVKLEGATKPEYQMISDKLSVSDTIYQCEVTAGEQTKVACFYVKIDTGLTLNYPRYQYGIKGDSVTLNVQADSKIDKLTYSWYEGEEAIEGKELISGEDCNSYTFTLSEPKKYICKVSDGITIKYADIQMEMGEVGEKKVENLILTGNEMSIEFCDLGKNISFSGMTTVRYEDGTEDWMYSGMFEKWDNRAVDVYGRMVPGKYEGYKYYKGATSIYDVLVIGNSDIKELQTEVELKDQVQDETTAYHCYKFSVTETGNYAVMFSDVVGTGKYVLLSEEPMRSVGSRKLSQDDLQDYKLEAGTAYYLIVTAEESTEFSYTVNVTQDYWQEILLENEISVKGDSYGYYKYIPQKSGMYKLEEPDAVEKRDIRVYYEIINKDKIIASGDRYEEEWMNLKQLYLKQGETYYFRISNSDDSVCEFMLKNMEYIEYPSTIVAAGKYDALYWTLSDAGLLSISSEDGRMPAAPWSEFSQEIMCVDIGTNITEIADDAFRGCINITSIQLPDNIVSIGVDAFWNCEMLTEPKLPSKLKKIGDNAFYRCSSIEKIDLPASLEEIGGWAFGDCTKLKQVNLPKENQLVLVGPYILSNTEWMKSQKNPVMLGSVMLGCQGDNTNVVVTEGVSAIAGSVFYGAELENITLPNTLKGIGSYALGSCTKLKQVTIPGSVTAIAYRAFDNCTSLENIFLTEGVKSLGEAAFSDCNALKTVTIPKSVTDIDIYAIGYERDWENGNMKRVENLPTIQCYSGSAAYTYAVENKIPYVLLSDSETTTKPSGDSNTSQPFKPSEPSTHQTPSPIGQIVQSDGCNYKITSQGTVTLTGLKKTKTKKLSIPKTININGTKYIVTAIGDKAFKNAKITSLNIGSDIKTIGTSAFEGCKSLTKVTIGSGVAKIDKNAFKNCKKLKTITIKSTKLKAIGKNAFKGVKSTAKIKVPKKKLTAYKKMLKKAGVKQKVQVVK